MKTRTKRKIGFATLFSPLAALANYEIILGLFVLLVGGYMAIRLIQFCKVHLPSPTPTNAVPALPPNAEYEIFMPPIIVIPPFVPGALVLTNKLPLTITNTMQYGVLSNTPPDGAGLTAWVYLSTNAVTPNANFVLTDTSNETATVFCIGQQWYETDETTTPDTNDPPNTDLYYLCQSDNNGSLTNLTDIFTDDAGNLCLYVFETIPPPPGIPYYPVVIQWSPDLRQWTPVYTNPACPVYGVECWTDFAAPEPMGFYRTVIDQ